MKLEGGAPERPRMELRKLIPKTDSEESSLSSGPLSPMAKLVQEIRKAPKGAKAPQPHERLEKERPAPANINYEIITNWVSRVTTVDDIKNLLQGLYEKPLGDPSDEGHYPGYPWDENPDDIIGALTTYLASERTDEAALERIPQECGLRKKVVELVPPQTVH